MRGGSGTHRTAPRWAALAAGCLALAWAGTAACGYRFGVGDQAQYLVRYVHLRHAPGLGADPYLRAFEAIRSWVWDPLAWLVPEAALPGVVLGLTLACAAANAGVLAWLAAGLLGERARRGVVGALALLAPAMVLVVPKELNWFGLVALADVEFTATLAAGPLALACIALFARGRVWWSLAAAVACVPVQGQVAAYALAAWVVAAAWVWRGSAARVAGVGAVAICGVAAFLAVRGGVGPSAMEAYRGVGLGLYAPLVDPARAPRSAWGACAAVCGLGLLAWPGLTRMGGDRAVVSRLGAFWAATLVLPLACTGLIALGWREPMLWKLMPGRGLMLTQVVALVVFAAWAAGSALRGGRGAWVAGGALAAVVVWPFAGMGAVAGGIGLVTVGAAVVVARWMDRAAVGERARRWRCGLHVGVPAVAALGIGVVAFAGREHAWLAPGGDRAWAQAQAWAREHTPAGAVFVTPPYRAGWRVGSHRATFGELRDGGLLFYAGEPAVAWADRMRLLGMDSFGHAWRDGAAAQSVRAAYAAALRERGAEVLAASGAAYIVCEAGEGVGLGEVAWSNGALEVRRVGGGVLTGAAALDDPAARAGAQASAPTGEGG